MAKKRKANLASILIIVVIAIVILQSGIINYWQPTPVMLSLAGSNVHIADTWQKWNIQLNSATGPTSTYESAKKYIYLPFQVAPATSGRLYYAEVDIPIKYLGGLPTGGTIGKADYWYISVEILGKARVYLNDLGHFVGETNLASVHFDSYTTAGTVKDVKFIIGTHDGIKYYTGRFGIPAVSKPIDIESYLQSLGISSILEYTCIVEVTEVWVAYKVRPFTVSGIEATTKLDEFSVTFPGQVKFSLPQTWTGTYATTTTWQTQTWGATGSETVTVTVVIPSTSIVVQPTTIGTNTFTGYSTVYSGTTITRTWTPVTPPPEFPDWLKWLRDGIWDFFKSLFGWNLSDWQLWLVIIGLVLFVILLLYLLFRPRAGGGGAAVVVVRALKLHITRVWHSQP